MLQPQFIFLLHICGLCRKLCVSLSLKFLNVFLWLLNITGVAASSSVFSILAMSMDRYIYINHLNSFYMVFFFKLFQCWPIFLLFRYFAIRHPIVFRQFFNKRVARCVILSIWLVAGLIFIPTLIVQREHIEKLSNTLMGKSSHIIKMLSFPPHQVRCCST